MSKSRGIREVAYVDGAAGGQVVVERNIACVGSDRVQSNDVTVDDRDLHILERT